MTHFIRSYNLEQTICIFPFESKVNLISFISFQGNDFLLFIVTENNRNVMVFTILHLGSFIHLDHCAESALISPVGHADLQITPGPLFIFKSARCRRGTSSVGVTVIYRVSISCFAMPFRLLISSFSFYIYFESPHFFFFFFKFQRGE